MKIVKAILVEIIFFFVCELLLILRIGRKNHLDICKRTLDIDFERDWSVDLGAMLGECHREN